MFSIKIFTFSPIQENTYVLYNEEKEALIIDPGCYSVEEKEELKNFIDAEGLNVELLLNTHCHLDHIFGNKFIAETYGLKLQIHPKEEQMLKMAPASGLMFDLPFDNYSGELVFFQEGDIITLGRDELEVIFVPGHSPGHVCFYCKDQAFLIGGDVLFNRSIGRTDLPGGDLDTLLKNIKQKIFTLPGNVIVYSGHGPQTDIQSEIKYNPFTI